MVRTKLPIEYNHNSQLGALNDDPTTFLLLEKFFDDVYIVTDRKQHWLEDLPLSSNINSLNMPVGKNYDTEALLRSKRFFEYQKNNPKIKFDLYQPLDPPYKVNPLVYLMNSPTIAHAYENKRYFRDEFSDLIRMPEYENKYISELDKAASYRDLHDEYGDFVLQDEESHGSKGTYIVKDYEDYTDAVRGLKKYSRGRSVVVSKFYPGETSSIQVCITKYGIFSGGIQRQLLGSKHLSNPKLEGVAKWCGGELGTEYPDIVQHQAQEMATIVGSELASHGYKGIFGIDIIVTPENEVYAIEINARHTGYSHLISNMQLLEGKIPFMLLHVLELGNFEYEVKDLDALPSMGRYKKPVSYLIVNNPLDEDYVMEQYIRPGVYRYKDGKIEFEKSGIFLNDLKGEDTFIVHTKYNQGEVIGKGRRILKITKFGKAMSKGDLNLKSQAIVDAVKKEFGLPQ
ncbi:MAG TPA: ATP-grasp domain-containing protein [Candidatus Saccharimonadales bacterium]|nr:ATP-grasp domain-containing protein [Candidatus Saccharimonadales bacterium]